jgi:dihydrodipicolinate reductase
MQAVVNEHTDFRIINAELVAALDKRDDKSHLLEASLLAKEEQLESLTSQQKVYPRILIDFSRVMHLQVKDSDC